MKSLLVIATAVLLVVGCARAADQSPFPADITHGNIRCVLMSVGQTTVFPNEMDNAQKAPPWRDSKQGVRCFSITFLVEALGDAPFEPHTLKNLEFSSGGKPLRLDGGVVESWFDYSFFKHLPDFSKPKVSNPKRAVIMQYVQYGAVPNLQPLSLVFETGFAKDIQKFQFDGIRLQ
jgi:hypothetical protein